MGLSLCYLSLNLCPVSLTDVWHPNPSLTSSSLGLCREGKGRRAEAPEEAADGMPNQQQRTILLLAQGRSTDVNAISHSAFLSLCKKMFCLTSYYNCGDSRYEELQILKGQREWNSLGIGIRPPVFEDIPIKSSYRKEARVPENWILCLFLVYNLLK